jgi:hypothetical protein
LAEINFLEIFHNDIDKETLRNMVNEVTQLYGFPCTIKQWTGIQTSLDPLYSDQLSMFQKDEDFYEVNNTYVYIDYNRLNQVLNSYGLAQEKNTSLNGFMKLDDHPRENDLITIKLPYDDRLLTFKIGSSDIHKDICYSVVLQIAHFEQQRPRS